MKARTITQEETENLSQFITEIIKLACRLNAKCSILERDLGWQTQRTKDAESKINRLENEMKILECIKQVEKFGLISREEVANELEQINNREYYDAIRPLDEMLDKGARQ